MGVTSRSRRIAGTAVVVALVSCLASSAVGHRNAPPFEFTVQTGAAPQPPVNSLTGQYLWFPQDQPVAVGSEHSPRDSYARFLWRDIEPSPGRFSFELIDRELEAAQRRGGRFAFRVMAVCTTCGRNAMPADLSRKANAWTAASEDDSIRVPDWNSPVFLERWARLMSALGDRFDGDPRLSYVDVGAYGNWGEGHNWPYARSYPGPTGQEEATPESIRTMVRAATSSFTLTFTVVNPPVFVGEDGGVDVVKSWEVLKTALQLTPRLGLRNDCLGGGQVQAFAAQALTAAQRLAESENVPLEDQPLQRWRTAPFVTEWCDSIHPDEGGGSFLQGERQVRAWHVTQVSNGNFQGRLSDYPAAERQAFVDAQSHAGFRIGVDRAVVSRESRGRTRIASTWRNRGSAPTYDAWQVAYRLVRIDTGEVLSATSELDLRSVLPGGRVTDVVDIPHSETLRGPFRVEVVVQDPRGYLPPMELDRGSKTPEGTIELGRVLIP